MAKIIEKVPKFPAESFYEAVMSVNFFLSTLFGLYPLGRPDKYLLELYEKDVAEGNLTTEFAQELIDNLCLAVSDRVFSRAACGIARPVTIYSNTRRQYFRRVRLTLHSLTMISL